MKTAAGEERPRTLWLPFGFAACVALLIFWAVVSARRADFQHRLSIDAFTPMIQGIVALGARFEQNVIPRIARVGQTISALLMLLSAVGLVLRRGKGLKPALLLFALAFAVYGQCLLLQREIPGGIRLYGAALVFVIVAELLPKRFGSFAPQETGGAPSILEFVALAFVTAVALLYRFYALNQLPNDFEGEAAYFMACATSFRSAALVNAGVANGPWSPFGWLYYIPVYLVTKLFGSHLLSIRFVSALAGVVSVPLLWALLRRLAGPVEALLGSVLLCFGLTEMFWSRTDVFPYNAPGVIGIALAWCTYEAIVRERLGYFVLAAVLMAVSFHQFPSGQTLFLVPLGAVGVHALLERGFFKRCWKMALILVLGAALWYSGHSLNVLLATGQLKKASPFALNPGKTLWSLPVESPDLLRRVESLARKVEQNAADVVRSKFVEIVFGPHPHHEGIPGLQGIATREISAAAAVLLALGLPLLLLRLKTPASQVVLVWIIAALLPGLLSTSASAHRTATVFPASFAAAALAGGDVVRAIRKLLGKVGTIVVAMGGGTLFAGLAVVAARLYLDTASSSTPPTVVMADAIRPYFAEGTLAVLDIDGGDYLGSELTYLFIDDLSRGSRPPLWRISRASDWPEIAFHPRPGYDDWYYTYTRLRNRREAFMGEPPPKRVVFLVQDTPERRSHVELLSQLYPTVAPQRHVVSESPRQYNFVAFVVESANLYEAMSPLVQGGKAVSNPNGPAAWWEGREVRAVNAAPSTTITVSAGVWIPRQRWSRFRVPGAGEGSRVLLDGTLLDERTVRPITRGVHRIEIQLGKSPRLPLYLEEAAETQDYRRFPPENVLAPELAMRSAFAPDTVVPYPGYDPPIPLTALERAFFADVTVSPSGELGSLWAYENRWKVVLHPPGGREVVWEVPRPQERSEYSRLAFAGEHIALLNSPNLFLLDRGGHVLLKKDLGPQIEGAHDLAANEKGELFVSALSGIHVLSPRGEPETTLSYSEFGPNWKSVRASVPYRGPIAVLDGTGKIRVFEPISRNEWRVVRTQPGLYPLESRLFQVRDDGWLFARVWDWPEVLVFDPSMNRRIARDSAHDLSSFEMGSQFAGFDRNGNLYTYNEGSGQVFVFTKRTE